MTAKVETSWALPALLLLVALAALAIARDLLLPVVVAGLLALVFRPAVRGMEQRHLPAPVGAALVLLLLLTAFVSAIYHLSGPAGEWLDRAPQSLREIDHKLRRITGPVHDVANATAEVQNLTQRVTEGRPSKPVQEVIVQQPGLASSVLDAATGLSLVTVSTLVLLYFLLASGDLFLRKAVAAAPTRTDKRRVQEIAQEVESAVSRYLLTVALINLCLGSIIAIGLHLLGVPNPVLWGVMVGVLNFVPYLGDIASFTVLTLVGLLTFDDPWRGLMVPGLFWLLTAIEGYLITPLIVGRRMNLNPVVIVLSVLFWGWIWGVPGALVAVPVLLVLKTICDRVASLQLFGEFLGD